MPEFDQIPEVAEDAPLPEQVRYLARVLKAAVRSWRTVENDARKWRIGFVVAAVVIAAGACVAGFYAFSAHRALADYKASNATARIASCQQFDKQQTQNVAAQIQLSHDFVAALTAGSTRPDIAKRAAAFNASHDALITKAYPLRDCSPAGIRKYLKQP